MKKAEFKEFVKEMFIDLITNDDEVKEIVLEFVAKNSSILSESSQKNIPKEPEDLELYDRLTLIASGRQKNFKYNGKSISSPNHGTGFRSPKMIKEWSDKAYSKIGGKWTSAASNENHSSYETFQAFSNIFGNSNSGELSSIAMGGNDSQIRSAIKSKMNTNILDENLQPGADIADLLLDTAKTTFKNFPMSHDNNSGVGVAQESFSGTPEQVFGEASSHWAKLAFPDSNREG